MISYKKKFSLTERKKESQRIRNKFPNRVPVLIEKKLHQQGIKNQHVKKYLVPSDFTMAQFSYVFRNKMKIKPEEAIYFFISESSTLCPNSYKMNQIDKEYKDQDGFLYMEWSLENTFGSGSKSVINKSLCNIKTE